MQGKKREQKAQESGLLQIARKKNVLLNQHSIATLLLEKGGE